MEIGTLLWIIVGISAALGLLITIATTKQSHRGRGGITFITTWILHAMVFIVPAGALVLVLPLNTVHSTSGMGKVDKVEYNSKRGDYTHYSVKIEGIDKEIEPQRIKYESGVTEPYMNNVTQVWSDDFTWLKNTHPELVVDSKYENLDQVTIYP